ncbi:MAG: pyrimidine 5'-nucleotidase [Anaerolineae bacterium]|jgi:putative hydrolase of the HAD superfamily
MSFEWIIFDLDNTLYPRDSGLMEELGRRIQAWLCDRLNLNCHEARDLRRDYLHRYGTTLGGLMAERRVEAKDYLDFVHDIRIEDYLQPHPALREMLEGIPLRRVVYTNATSEYGQRVLQALGVIDQFERIIGIDEVGLRNKLCREAYIRMLALLETLGPACMMVEDSTRNLQPAKDLGLTTILVAGEAEEYVDFVVEGVLEVGRLVDRLLRHA